MTVSGSCSDDQVWPLEVAYWDYLAAGDASANLSLWHDEVMAWPGNQPAPMSKHDIGRRWAGIVSAVRPGSFRVELIPLTLLFFGDVAVVNYEYRATAAMQDDAELILHEKVTHTWLRTRDGWKIIAGMSASL